MDRFCHKIDFSPSSGQWNFIPFMMLIETFFVAYKELLWGRDGHIRNWQPTLKLFDVCRSKMENCISLHWLFRSLAQRWKSWVEYFLKLLTEIWYTYKNTGIEIVFVSMWKENPERYISSFLVLVTRVCDSKTHTTQVWYLKFSI